VPTPSAPQASASRCNTPRKNGTTNSLNITVASEFICPPKAIAITPGEIPSDDEWAKVEKRPKAFEIDMTRCIYCGMCEEVCPEQAIYLRQDYAVTGTDRKDLLHDKKRLYEIGGKRVGLVNKWNDLK